MSNLLSRLDEMLSVPAKVEVPPEHRRVQDALSGAVGEKVVVRPWIDGNLAVAVSAKVFVPNGLRMVESAVAARPGTLAGTTHAVANAERRLAKMIGEGWGARLVDFDDRNQLLVFTVFQHA